MSVGEAATGWMGRHTTGAVMACAMVTVTPRARLMTSHGLRQAAALACSL